MSLKKAYAGTFESNDIYITIEEKPQDHGVHLHQVFSLVEIYLH